MEKLLGRGTVMRINEYRHGKGDKLFVGARLFTFFFIQFLKPRNLSDIIVAAFIISE